VVVEVFGAYGFAGPIEKYWVKRESEVACV
jgi:hypothetical protein